MPPLARIAGRGARPASARPRPIMCQTCFTNERGRGRGQDGGAHSFSTSDASQQDSAHRTLVIRRSPSTVPPSETSTRSTRSIGRTLPSSQKPSPWSYAPVVHSGRPPPPPRELVNRPTMHFNNDFSRRAPFTRDGRTNTPVLGFEDFVREAGRMEGMTRFPSKKLQKYKVTGYAAERFQRRRVEREPKHAHIQTQEEIEFIAAIRNLSLRERRGFDARIRAKCERRQIAKMHQFAMSIVSPGVEEIQRKRGTLHRWHVRTSADRYDWKHLDTGVVDKLIAQITSMIEMIQIVQVVVLEVRAYHAALKAALDVHAAIEAGKPNPAVHLQLVWAPCPHSGKKQSTWFPSRLRSWWEKNYFMMAENGLREETTGAKISADKLHRLATLPTDDPRYKPYEHAITLALQAERAAVEAGLAKYAKTRIVIDVMWERWSEKWESFKEHHLRSTSAAKRRQRQREPRPPPPREEEKGPFTKSAEPTTAQEEPAVLGEKTARKKALVNRLLHGHKSAKGEIGIRAGPRTVVWR